MDKYYYIRHNNIISYEWRLDDRYNIGKTYEDSTRGKYVPLSKAQVEYLKRHQSATAYEVWHMEEQQPYTPTIEDIRAQKISEIQEYDKSDAVNVFQLNGLPMWLDRETRISLHNSLEIERRAGRTTSELWYKGIKLEGQIDMLLGLLDQLELYALDCFKATARHLATVSDKETMNTIQLINDYDHTKDYPTKLIFTL